MPNGHTYSNDKLYEAINSMRLELKGDIRDLRNQFDRLEAGRLTRLEAKMNDFEIDQTKRDANLDKNQAVLSTKFIIISAIGVAIFNALLYAFFAKVIK